MKLFSQRMGLTEDTQFLQLEEISDDLRNRLWNAMSSTWTFAKR